MKGQIVYRNDSWWVVWPSTGNNAWLHWRGPYRWRWIAIYKRWYYRHGSH